MEELCRRIAAAEWRIIMKISEILKSEPITISMEVFPPKSDVKLDSVRATVREIARLKPAFVSCTYGAGGGTSRYTVEISQDIMEEGVASMAHLTCISSTRDSVHDQIARIKEAGIQNILALRGDIVPDMPPKTDFKHASDLTAFIKSYGGFNIAGACYPEVHPDSGDEVEDIINLKKKVDAGAELLISQLFFDNESFYSFLQRCRLAGINVPVEAGIMPVVNKNQIQRMVSLCGASLPAKFTRIMNRYEHNPEALRDAGIAYAVDQCVDLIANGVSGIHLYTMNNPYVARRITEAIGKLL